MLIRNYGTDAIGSFSTTIALYADETEAELKALEFNEHPRKDGYVDYLVQMMILNAPPAENEFT